jgi:quinol monooxygenase YgiN
MAVGAAVAAVALAGAATTEAKTQGKTMTNEEKIQALWDKQEITEVINKFARALDRMDGELMKACYWEDGTEEHQDPLFPQFGWNDKAWPFVPIAMKGFESLKLTQHRISNVLIELDGDQATAEAYVWAYHIHEEDGVDKEGVLYGRHNFRFEKRNDEWLIKHRSTIFDWNANQDASAVWGEGYSDKLKGKRGDFRDDSYNYIEQDKRKLLTFYVEFDLKPEHVEEFNERLHDVLESMSEEDTFVDAYMHQDANDPNKFSVYERWTEPSAEAFMKNQLQAKEYRKEYEARIPEILATPREITFLEPLREWKNPNNPPSSDNLAFYVNFHVKPDRVDEWKQGALGVLEAMTAEDTFVSCQMHQDANDPTKFTLYERWSEPSMDAFVENQLKAKAYRDAYEKVLPEQLASPRTFAVLDTIQLWER